MKQTVPVRRLGSRLRRIMDPNEKNKYLVALIAALAAAVSALAAVVLRPDQPGPTKEWIGSANAICERAERTLDKAYEGGDDLPTIDMGTLANRPREELFELLDRGMGAIKGLSEAARTAANELAAVPAPIGVQDRVNGSIEKLNAAATSLDAIVRLARDARSAGQDQLLILMSRLQEPEGHVAELKTAFQSLALAGPKSCATVIG